MIRCYYCNAVIRDEEDRQYVFYNPGLTNTAPPDSKVAHNNYGVCILKLRSDMGALEDSVAQLKWKAEQEEAQP